MKLKWDLDCFFLGGSNSSELKKELDSLSFRVTKLKQIIQSRADLKKAILELQDLNIHLSEADRFIACLHAQDVTDVKAHLLQEQVTTIKTKVANISNDLDEWLITLNTKALQKYLQEETLNPISFAILERRQLAQEMLPAKEEVFINDLAINGFHGWTQMWDALIGNMIFPFQGEHLSFSQMENKMADPNRSNRQIAFESITNAFRNKQTLFAQTLNHLAGYRLTVYGKRGWTNVLKKPLADNRMHEKTLKTMWNMIAKYRDKLKTYMQCKADLLQIAQLNWYDLEAPIGKVTKQISYEEATSFIIKHFSHFSPKMGEFSKAVLQKQWIDAEDRPNKYPGGFCVCFPVSRQSRIFMTYANTITNVFTLAHELGHAYHNFVVSKLPGMAQDLRMNVAETASTMAEITVTRAAIETSTTKIDRLFLLDDHLSRAVSYLMNIHARFLFEMRFYNERKKGFIPSEQLNEFMTKAQQEAYGNGLGVYHPYFWAAKMHFQLSDVSFYNFPYTFGYLFSLGIHQLSLNDENFEEKYISLLEDTGRMRVEDLAYKHLNVDLTKPNFWEISLQSISNDIDMYLELARTKY